MKKQKKKKKSQIKRIQCKDNNDDEDSMYSIENHKISPT